MDGFRGGARWQLLVAALMLGAIGCTPQPPLDPTVPTVGGTLGGDSGPASPSGVTEGDAGAPSVTTPASTGTPPLQAACACVPSHGVAVLSCGSGFPTFAGHDAPEALVSATGDTVVFNRCALDASGSCTSELVRWTPAGGPTKLADAWAFAVGADGTTILADAGDATGVSDPVVWLQGTFVDLNLAGAYAHLLSADGNVVAARVAISIDVAQAALWTSTGGLAPLGDLPGGLEYSEPEAITADGSVVVGYGNTTGGQEPFVWTAAGGMLDLGALTEVEQTVALATNSDGTAIVGTSLTDSGTAIFRWTAGGGMVGLALRFDNLSGLSLYQLLWTPPLLISGDGQAVAGTASNPDDPRLPEAFRWTAAANVVALTAADASIVRAASADGSRILGARLSGAPASGPAIPGSPITYAPFVWDGAQGAQDLAGLLSSAGADLAGLTLGDPIAISADGGTVVGHATCGGDAVIYRAVLAP
jgi:probable HAF family extracellular repeat protein